MGDLFLMPGYIVSGNDALNSAKEYIKILGKRALIVTDSTMVKLGNVKRMTNLLDDIGIMYVVYGGVNSEPTDIIVEDGINEYRTGNCDFLIALGGGSAIDAAKAIGAMITNPGKINDYIGKVIQNPIPPLTAVPTTAGTGSEATQFTIISDTKRSIKMLLKGPYLMPRLSIIDPAFTLTSPPNVTSSTGLDALTHAVEAYTSRKSQPMSDTFAISAVKRIFKYLPKAYEDGNDVSVREQMSIAALEAGIAFNNSSVTIVHGMSRPIGALFHVPHGLSNAMLLYQCLKFALSGAPEKFCDLAKAIGVYRDGMSDVEGGQAFIKAAEALCNRLHIETLKDFGADREKFFNNLEKMADDALQSGSPQNTRRIPDKEDIINIYKRIFDSEFSGTRP